MNDLDLWFHNIYAVSFQIICGCLEGEHSLGEIMQNHVVLWYCGGSQEAAVAGGAELQHLQEDWKKRVSEKQNRCFCISCGIARAHIGAVQLEDILFGWRH